MGFGVAAFATKWLAQPDRLRTGGRGGIRTHGTLAGTPVFKTGALNRSATLPSWNVSRLAYVMCEGNVNRAWGRPHPIKGDRSLRRKGVGRCPHTQTHGLGLAQVGPF